MTRGTFPFFAPYFLFIILTKTSDVWKKLTVEDKGSNAQTAGGKGQRGEIRLNLSYFPLKSFEAEEEEAAQKAQNASNAEAATSQDKLPQTQQQEGDDQKEFETVQAKPAVPAQPLLTEDEKKKIEEEKRAAFAKVFYE